MSTPREEAQTFPRTRRKGYRRRNARFLCAARWRQGRIPFPLSPKRAMRFSATVGPYGGARFPLFLSEVG